MFNNCDIYTNGEILFFKKIEDRIKVIFDVGAQCSIFTDFKGEVHYFDPDKVFIDDLRIKPTNNSKSFFNDFGLGNNEDEIEYFPRYQSFFNRTKSCGVCDDSAKKKFLVKKASNYIIENNIQSIDFLKIDTEGFELEVLKGFDSYLNIVKIIQFEYGGTFIDNGLKLMDIVSYLTERGFVDFRYLTDIGSVAISDFSDHYQYCNIICTNSLFSLIENI
jgi:FkbM family methyltransferase